MNAITKHGVQIVVVFSQDFESFNKYEQRCRNLVDYDNFERLMGCWQGKNHYTIFVRDLK